MKYLLILGLILIAGCSQTGSRDTQSWDNPVAVQSSTVNQSGNQNVQRDFWSKAILPSVSRSAQDWDNPIATPFDNIESINIAVWNERNAPYEPYVFTAAASASKSHGDIYYSDGTQLPTAIFPDGINPQLSGEWVFAVCVDEYNSFGQPVSVYIMRYNLETEIIEELTPPQSDLMWNYVLPAKGGDMYICVAMNFNLVGTINVIENGIVIWESLGSYLFPTISSDGSTSAWCYDVNPLVYGERDACIMDNETFEITIVHAASDADECQYIDLSTDGSVAVFSKVNGVWNGHGYSLHDQEIWRYESGTASIIDTLDYRWNEQPQISPDGNIFVWHGNKDVIETRGYTILSNKGEGTIEVIPYNSNRQYLWADVTDNGWFIYSHEVSTWSNFILNVANVEVDINDIETIINLNCIIRDAQF